MDMESQPSTSTSSNPTDKSATDIPRIKVPMSKTEAKKLKEGHFEADNADIGYMHFPLLVPNALFTLLSYSFFCGAVGISLYTDWIPPPEAIKSGFIVQYGASRFACQSDTPIEPNWLPSVLNLFEVNVIGNVLFRMSVGLPMVMRIFNSLTLRNLFAIENEEAPSLAFRIFNELLAPLMLVETLSLTLFAIITVHSDFKEIIIYNKVFKMTFSTCAVLSMFFTLAMLFSFTRRSKKMTELLSVLIKAISFAVFVFTSHQYFHNFQAGLPTPYCHSYVPAYYAYLEYAMIVAYGCFHTSILLDIRYAYLVCYPRTCSGETQPLKPENFTKGGEFEFCRSFEYNQRRILSS